MGLVCRVLETQGIATVCVATGRDLIKQVKPPRALFVNHPMGNNFGAAHDAATQKDIVLQALQLIHQGTAGCLHDYPSNWSKAFAFAPGG